MLPYAGGKTVTFRAYVGQEFKDTALDVQNVLVTHHAEMQTNVKLLDFSRDYCVFSVAAIKRLRSKQITILPMPETYAGNYVCGVALFLNMFFEQEVENAILLDLEQEYKAELGERGDVEAEDKTEKTAKQ